MCRISRRHIVSKFIKIELLGLFFLHVDIHPTQIFDLSAVCRYVLSFTLKFIKITIFKVGDRDFLCCRYRLQVLDENSEGQRVKKWDSECNEWHKLVPLSFPWHCQYSQSRTAHWQPLLGSPASPSRTAKTQQHTHMFNVSSIKSQNCRAVPPLSLTSSSLSALSHSFWPGACWVHMVMSWLMLSVTALWIKEEQQRSQVRRTEWQRDGHWWLKNNCYLRKTDRAAVASWFLRLGELGSVDKALAANSSLLEDIEIVFRLDTTCVWSSFDWKKESSLYI